MYNMNMSKLFSRLVFTADVTKQSFLECARNGPAVAMHRGSCLLAITAVKWYDVGEDKEKRKGGERKSFGGESAFVSHQDSLKNVVCFKE